MTRTRTTRLARTLGAAIALAVTAHVQAQLIPTDLELTPDLTPEQFNAAAQGNFRRGHVFTLGNQTDGNQVFVFARGPFGTLDYQGAWDTGGLGSGGNLGNQGALAFARHRFILATNAVSNTVSVLRRANGQITDHAYSGGLNPVSVTAHGDTVYVLNAGSAVGGSDGVAGFRLTPRGDLEPIAQATPGLGGPAVGASQVGFSPDGQWLVVTERAVDLIAVFPVHDDGTIGAATISPSAGQTPFGFDFTSDGVLVVSEAAGGNPDAGTASSYTINPDGSLTTIAAAVPTTESAACWLEIAGDAFAYTANTGSGTLTGFELTPAGDLIPTTADGVSADTGGPVSTPTDVDSTGAFLYVLNRDIGEIDAFLIDDNGALTPIDSDGGLPAFSTGMLAD